MGYLDEKIINQSNGAQKLDMGDCVDILVITSDGIVIGNNQQDYGLTSRDFTVFAGGIEKGESELEAVKRELGEELGINLDEVPNKTYQVFPLLYTSSGITNERSAGYIVRLEMTMMEFSMGGYGCKDENENITVQTVDIETFIKSTPSSIRHKLFQLLLEKEA
ncbi:MAG: NUDIX domain-containing protein [Paraclostridium sp.]